MCLQKNELVFLFLCCNNWNIVKLSLWLNKYIWLVVSKNSSVHFDWLVENFGYNDHLLCICLFCISGTLYLLLTTNNLLTNINFLLKNLNLFIHCKRPVFLLDLETLKNDSTHGKIIEFVSFIQNPGKWENPGILESGNVGTVTTYTT